MAPQATVDLLLAVNPRRKIRQFPKRPPQHSRPPRLPPRRQSRHWSDQIARSMGARVRGFGLRAIGLDRMCQENKGAGQANSHRYQLSHRTHRSYASPRSVKGALPAMDIVWENGLPTPGSRRKLVDPCDRLAGGLRSSHVSKATPPGSKYAVPAAPVSNRGCEIPVSSFQ